MSSEDNPGEPQRSNTRSQARVTRATSGWALEGISERFCHEAGSPRSGGDTETRRSVRASAPAGGGSERSEEMERE